MNVTLPDSLKEFVEKQAASGSYANPDAFVAELVQTEAERLDRVSRGEAFELDCKRNSS
jgi:Arc/MetJ-type ribon-helix-helix transcriptional regulator